MFSLYPSHPRPLYYSPPVYSNDDLYSPYVKYPHPRSPIIGPEVRYRRALVEYLAAEEVYKALQGARQARLRAHADALRQEQARARLAHLARARKQQQARQFRQGLAEALARAGVPEDDDLSSHRVPVRVMYWSSEQPLSDMSCLCAGASCANGANVKRAQHDEEGTSLNQPRLRRSVPDLESLLRERLQKKAGDEEVQDLARAILRHLTSVTGASCPAAAASSPEVNASSTDPSEGANLSRSHALKGVAAETAKASFKAHRAEVAERDESSPTSPTSRTASSSLSVIQDIRSALTKLSAGFSLPSSLEFSDDEPDGLAYTPTNAPIRVYEHALDELLAQLDAVETDGDDEVRVVRRAAVKEVEKAIEDVEKRVKEAKESAKGSNPESVVSTEADLTEGKNSHAAVDVEPSVDNDKPEADELSSDSSDLLDSVASSPEIVLPLNHKVALPHVTNATDSESVPATDILKDQSSSPDLEPIHSVVPVVTPSVATTDQDEASVSTDGISESKQEVVAEEATTGQTTSIPSKVTPSTTRAESPSEVSLPVLGAIAPSSTPVAPVLPSIIFEDLPGSLSRHQLSASLGEDGVDDADVDDDWTEI